MAFNFYLGWTEQQLLDERRRLQESIAPGALASWGEAGSSATRERVMSVQSAIGEVQKALYHLDPNKYRDELPSRYSVGRLIDP